MAVAMSLNVVTGGAGYFGEILVRKLLDQGERVVVFDLNKPGLAHPRLRSIVGDIRDATAVRSAFKDAAVVYHNVAQVPLAKDAGLFWSVNRNGTENVLRASVNAGAARVIYTSSSAVFGIPLRNPVTEETEPRPMEDYGRAKHAGELLCAEYEKYGLLISIIRPRTILGHGRLGIFQILFEWIYQGLKVPVLGHGDNIYQFVHADDLASACILARQAPRPGIYNIGSATFGTMRETLEALIRHAGSNSKLRSVPKGLAKFGMNVTSSIGLSPLAAYHALMYGESLYFDLSKARRELGFEPKYTQDQAMAESYDWYVANRSDILSGSFDRSAHQSALRLGLLRLLPYLL
jgi:nucleoside-diphosphate-sugar epimerase